VPIIRYSDAIIQFLTFSFDNEIGYELDGNKLLVLPDVDSPIADLLEVITADKYGSYCVSQYYIN
jgi:hypothetical protein